jgi:hypothetical protein
MIEILLEKPVRLVRKMFEKDASEMISAEMESTIKKQKNVMIEHLID